ncbi:putative fluoride ion transporter CrcB [Verrucomicrobiota bacterium]|jgi:CrcB protein|nr:putative fluoride ion transporter CrcB [Verrucomicrobiota bacterium]
MTQGTFTTYVQVALGGATGSVLRFWLGSVIGHKAGAPFWGTLFVNVTGCFLIGLLGNLRENGPAEFDRYFLMVGVLGGYTTFSTFSLQTLELLQKGSAPLALANIALSLVLCLLGVWLGHALGAQWKS